MSSSPEITPLPELLCCVVCQATHPCIEEALAAGWICFEGRWRCNRDRSSLQEAGAPIEAAPNLVAVLPWGR